MTEPSRRCTLRLKGFDYTTPGAYFVTICAHQRAELFGEVNNGRIRLSQYGSLVRAAWQDLPNHYGGVRLGAFVIMPNHVHGILRLEGGPAGDVGAGFKPAPTMTTKHNGLSEVIRGFKTFSARRINERRNTTGGRVWQRGYYEHIVRDDESLKRIEEYILSNPSVWERDPENPVRTVVSGAQGYL